MGSTARPYPDDQKCDGTGRGWARRESKRVLEVTLGGDTGSRACRGFRVIAFGLHACWCGRRQDLASYSTGGQQEVIIDSCRGTGIVGPEAWVGPRCGMFHQGGWDSLANIIWLMAAGRPKALCGHWLGREDIACYGSTVSRRVPKMASCALGRDGKLEKGVIGARQAEGGRFPSRVCVFNMFVLFPWRLLSFDSAASLRTEGRLLSPCLPEALSSNLPPALPPKDAYRSSLQPLHLRAQPFIFSSFLFCMLSIVSLA